MERPHAITPRITDAICGYLRAGHYFNVACRLADVSPGTAGEWLQRGENRHHRPPTQETIAFADAVTAASAEAEANALANVLAGGRGWNGPAWFLERRFPRRWGVRHIEGDGGTLAAGLVELYWSIVHDDDLGLSAEQAETFGRLLHASIRRIATSQGLGDEILDVPLDQEELPS